MKKPAEVDVDPGLEALSPEIEIPEWNWKAVGKAALEGIGRPFGRFGMDVARGTLGAAASATDLLAGVGTLPVPIPEFQSVKEGRQKAISFLRKSAEDARKQQKRIEEHEQPNLPERLIAKGAEMAISLPKYALATAAGGPVAGFGGLGALEARGQGATAKEQLLAGAQGAATGAVFKGVEGASLPVRSTALGGTFGGLSAIQGATPEQAAEAAIEGAVLGTIGAKGKRKIGKEVKATLKGLLKPKKVDPPSPDLPKPEIMAPVPKAAARAPVSEGDPIIKTEAELARRAKLTDADLETFIASNPRNGKGLRMMATDVNAGKLTMDAGAAELGRVVEQLKLPAQSPSVLPPGSTKPKTAGGKQRGFAQTMEVSPRTAEPISGQMRDLRYDPISNQATFDAAKKLVERNIDDAVASVKARHVRPTPETYATAQILVDQYQKAGRYQDAIDIVKSVSEKATSQGQAIQALSMWNRLTPEGALKLAFKTVEEARAKTGKMEKVDATVSKIMEGLQKAGPGADEQILKQTLGRPFTRKSKTFQQQILDLSREGKLTEGALRELVAARKGMPHLTDDIAKSVVDQAQALQGMPEGRGKVEATAQMLQIISDQIPSSILSRISLGQTMAQLINPKTAIRNIVGNTGFGAGELVTDTIAAPLDWMVGKVTGQRTVSLPRPKSLLKGAARGLHEAWRDVKLGINTAPAATQFDLPMQPAAGKLRPRTFKGPIGRTLEKGLNVMLRLPDRMAYQAWFDNSLDGQMRLAQKSGKALEKPTSEMLEKAHYESLYRTFQDDSAAARLFSGIKKSLNVGQEFGVGDLVLKYPKTPANLLSRGLAYSPAGFINTTIEMARPLIGQPFNQKAFVQGFTRAVIGSTAQVGLGALLHRLGIITGKPDKDWDIREARKMTGLGDYRINISALRRFVLGGFEAEDAAPREGDKTVSYDWFQPFAVSISIGANIDENLTDPKKAEEVGVGMAAAAMEAVQGGVDTLQEQPLVSGLTRTLQSGSLTEGAKRTLLSAPASFTPTLGSQINQLIDNTARSTYDPDPLKGMVKRAQGRIPGAAQKLPPQITVFGEEKERYPGGTNTLFNVFLNPSFIDRVKKVPEAQLALDLYERTGERKQAPRMISRKQTVHGVEVRLSPKQYEEMQRFVGTLTKQRFDMLIANPQFQKMSDESKINVMTAELTDIGALAKAKFLSPQVLEALEKKDKVSFLLGKVEIANTVRDAKAHEVYERMLALPTKEEKNAYLKSVWDQDADLAKRAKRIYKDAESGFSYEDRKVKRLPAKDGTRAWYIWNQIKDMPREEQNAYIAPLWDKRIVTDEVLDGVRYFIKNGDENDPQKWRERWEKKYNGGFIQENDEEE